MNMDPQMIGRRGEKRFDTLCSDAGVTCNRSVEDDYGWDKLIEFPVRTVPFAAIDMQPTHITAAVQVKTTVTASRAVSISLSNALRYAKSPIPQFIVLVALDGDTPRYYVRHVWGPLVADWLKVARQADADGVTEVHKRSVTLAFGPSDERGESLLAWIRTEIETVQPPYAAAKKFFVDTVGFEHGHGVGHVTFALEGPDDFLDLQLGLIPHLEAARFVFTSERFGIRAGKPEIDEANVRVHVTPEGRPCTLRLEFPKEGSASVPATLYAANQGPRFAFRIAARALDATYGPNGRIRAHTRLLWNERATLDELRAFAHLLAAKSDGPITIHLRIEGQLLDLGSIKLNAKGRDENWRWLALGMDVMRAIATEAEQSAADLTIRDVDDAIVPLHVLSAVASDRAVRVDFTPEPDAPATFDGFLAYASATVGDEVYSGVAYRPVGIDELHDGRRRVVFGPAKLLWGRIAPKACWSDDSVRAAYQRQLDRYGETAEIMAIGDLQKVAGQGPGDHTLKSDRPVGRERPRRLQAGPAGSTDERGDTNGGR